jgi:pimeloyl-ACP methyl ester carboxylesterase
MAIFVLCHGAWTGGWVWRAVAEQLRDKGHTVFAPTLTGLGERVHLAHPDVDLETHITDVVNVIHYEELTDVILVGYSYSGIVITGVANRIAERILHCVYLDAFVPGDGQAIANLVDQNVAAGILNSAQETEGGWLVSATMEPDDPLYSRATPQPIKTLTQQIRLSDVPLQLPHSFIYLTEDKQKDPLLRPITEAAQRVKADSNWQYYELKADHNAVVNSSEQVAKLLLTIASQADSITIDRDASG